MGLSFMSIFTVFGVVSQWAAQALADGKISYRELVQLGMQVAEALGSHAARGPAARSQSDHLHPLCRHNEVPGGANPI